jgi:hypothetical protein
MIMSARQSRLGVNVTADGGFTGAKLAGKIETDFFGGYMPSVNALSTVVAPTSNKWDSSILRLRYAFATATWDFKALGKLTVLAGQTDGLVNQLHPDSVSYAATPVFMAAGNLYRRAPQLRAQYDFKVMDMLSLTGQFALVSGTDGDLVASGATLDWGSGNKNAVPDVEVRVAAAVKPMADINFTLGVGYHMNKRVYPDGTTGPTSTLAPYALDGTTKSYTASLLGIDLDASITKYLGLKGEYYMGTGTDDMYAGIGSGTFDKDLSATWVPAGYRTSGYWVQAAIKPIPEATILLGMGQASVNTDDLLTANGGVKPSASLGTAREKNATIHAGVTANAGKNWRFSLEVARTTSTYYTTYTNAAAALPYPLIKPEMSATQISVGSRFVF